MPSLRPSVTLLHLSGLKLTQSTPNHHEIGKALEYLRTDLDRLDPDLKPSVLVLSGDLSDQGKLSELAQVQSFVEGLAGLLGIPRHAVVVLPGNHDINRKACEAYFNQCDADEQEPQPPYWPKLAHFASFFARLYEGLPALTFTEAAPYTLFELPERRCVIAALNSTIGDTHRATDHHGFLGETQLRAIAEQLRPYRERGWLRLAAVHHDYTRPEAVVDGDALRRILGPYLNLLLVGQAGIPQFVWLAQDLPVLRPAPGFLRYQLVHLEADRVVYGTRVFNEGAWHSAEGGAQNGWSSVPLTLSTAGAAFTPSGASAHDVAEAALASAVAVYRKRMVELCQRQTFEELATRGEDRELPHGLALIDIFVPQQVAPRLPACDLPGSALTEAAAVPFLAGLNGVGGLGGVSLTVEDAVTQNDWVLLLGAPGAGKSALTRWLCLKLCAPGEALPGVSPELIPVRIEARDLTRRAQAEGRELDLFSYLDAVHAERMLPLRGSALHDLHKRGRLLFLVDGLDEISDPALRLRCAELLVKLKNEHPARAVITSRIVGADQVAARLQQAGVAAFTMLDFDRPRIEQFVHIWYQRAFAAIGKPEEAPERTQRLLHALDESAPLAELCARPLLLTLMALLGRNGELPRQRHHLYQRAVDLLAEEWRPTPHGNLGLDRLGKLQYLRALAFHMLDETPDGASNTIPEAGLRRFTSEFLVKRDPADAATVATRVDALIEQLRARNQVLALVGGDAYGFVHRALLEYLAADFIRAQFAAHYLTVEHIEHLISIRWAVDAWREPLRLLCGMLGEDRPELVIRSLQLIATQGAIVDLRALAYLSFSLFSMGEIGNFYHELSGQFARGLIKLVQHFLTKANIQFFGFYVELNRALSRFSPRWLSHTDWFPWAKEILTRSDARPNELARMLIIATTIKAMEPSLRIPELIQLLAKEDRYGVIIEGALTVLPTPGSAQRLLEPNSGLAILARAVLLVLGGDKWLGREPALAQLRELHATAPNDQRIYPLVQLAELSFEEGASDQEAKLFSFVRDNYEPGLAYLAAQRTRESKSKLKHKFMQFILSKIANLQESLFDELPGALETALSILKNSINKNPIESYIQIKFLELYAGGKLDLDGIDPSDHQAVGKKFIAFISASQVETQRLLGWSLLADAYGTTRSSYRRLSELANAGHDPAVKQRATVALETLRYLYQLSRIGKPARRRAEVRLSGKIAGLLEETEHGTRFTYDPVYVLLPEAVRLSPTLPLRDAPFESVGLHPFFDNLLLEGWLLDLASQLHHLDRSDSFGLLLHTGSECVGAVEVYPLGEDGP